MHASPAGQRVSDYRGAATVLSDLPAANFLIADKGVEARLVSRGPDRSRNRALHPGQGEPQSPGPLRHRPLQAAQPHRAHGRQAQGLATHRNQLRPLRTHLHERNLHRRNRHILVMSPEPNQSIRFTASAPPVSAVPLPATLPLMLAGVAGLGWVSRRRKR
jgi:hypothetical protein